MSDPTPQQPSKDSKHTKAAELSSASQEKSSSSPETNSNGNHRKGSFAGDAKQFGPTTMTGITYDPAQADRSVKVAKVLTDPRFWRMASSVYTFSTQSVKDKMSKGLSKNDRRRRRGKRLTDTLVELGPTFIKLGQYLSVRKDFLPPEYADELAHLQDKVPPFSSDQVRAIITAELGAPPEKLFARFDEKPVASASIGQVHRAKLAEGKEVVIKVQRPDLAQMFYQDLGYMRVLARVGNMVYPKGNWNYWIELSDEFGRTVFNEINYIQEGRNADRVRTILKDRRQVRVPRVLWKLTGRRVLTLEYLPGIKADRIEELKKLGIDLPQIGNELVSCYLDQVLLHGFFHADPHAGNLSIDSNGNIIIYDFGMVGEINESQRDAITGCIASVIQRDPKQLVTHLVSLGIIKAEANVEPITRALQPFIEYYGGKEIRELDFTHLEQELDQIALEKALRFPPTLAYLLRAGSSLEGIARTLQPNFSFVEAAKPSLKKWVLSCPGQAATLIKAIAGERLGLSDSGVFRSNVLKPPDIQLPARINGKKRQAAEKTPPKEVADLQEVENLKARIQFLEQEVKQLSQSRVNLLTKILWQVALALLFFGVLLSIFWVPEYHQYTIYFLIGNGVMVAIIVWHLVGLTLTSRKSTGSKRGQRR